MNSPPPLKIESPHGAYALRFELKGNTLTCTRSLTWLSHLIPPEEYPSFKQFYEQIVRADNQSLVLRKGQ